MQDTNNSLEVYQDSKLIFSSQKHWLHPLLDLKEFLDSTQIDPSSLIVYDKIAGRAAAGIGIYLGLKNIHLEIASEYALSLYKDFNINVTYEKTVPLAICQTERLITADMSPLSIYDFIVKRVEAQKAKQ